MVTYCKDCRTEFVYCKKASEMHNQCYLLKKDFYKCKCGKIIEEIRTSAGNSFK
ncbi:MAG: hypothetical protein PHO61_03100 [Candidatus ainarchaeum sp.]|nr:hypothetical protein [Candidatus ainarchaeum sp.]